MEQRRRGNRGRRRRRRRRRRRKREKVTYIRSEQLQQVKLVSGPHIMIIKQLYMSPVWIFSLANPKLHWAGWLSVWLLHSPIAPGAAG